LIFGFIKVSPVECINKFKSLCAQETPTETYGLDAHNVFVSQSDYALLAILQEVEESILKMKRFECLFLTETTIRTMYFQNAVISDHLLHLIHAIPQDKIPASLSVDLFCCTPSSKIPSIHSANNDAHSNNILLSDSAPSKRKEHLPLTLYKVYQWVCKIYSYFCSTRFLKIKESQSDKREKNKVRPQSIRFKVAIAFPSVTTITKKHLRYENNENLSFLCKNKERSNRVSENLSLSRLQQIHDSFHHSSSRSIFDRSNDTSCALHIVQESNVSI
jgi:hypothetical protein